MKTLIWTVLALSLSGLAIPASQPALAAAPSDDSVRFIRLLRLDEMVSATLTSRVLKSFEAGRINESQLACLQTTSAADFTQGLAAAAHKELTPDELTRAIAFLGTKGGQFFGAMVSQNRANKITWPEMSASEREALTSFQSSSVWKKLGETALLTKTEGVHDVLAAFAKTAKSKCHLTQPLFPPKQPTSRTDS